jgi:asparagine synthase (glutamine-hydrolysing)
MCGISGFVDFKKQLDNESLKLMVKATEYRGPDDSGGEFYQNNSAYIGLGHNRLSIIDLTAAGHQPMHFEELSIVFNGEIYNFNEIKEELKAKGHSFQSHSDTEVILHAYQQWGKKCVDKFIGMFAFVIYDRTINCLVLFRDRAGVKPLFYYWFDDLFLFGSEIKPFITINRFKKEIDEYAVNLFMDYGYVPSPYCIFKNCMKLNPGHLLTLDMSSKKYVIDKYWDVVDYYRKPKLDISYDQAKVKLEAILISAFNYRMVADVPVGVFLSGGFDSTAVAAILQEERKEKIKTFTIGFEEGNNEAPYAKKIAEYLGTEHTELYCSTKDAQNIIPLLPFFFDEPFADSSAIPTILVSKIARQEVAVSLSADGGDEIFAGYIYYRSFLKNASLLLKIPSFIRKIIGIGTKVLYNVLPQSDFKTRLPRYIKALFASNKDIPFLLHESYFQVTDTVRKKLFKNTKLNTGKSIQINKTPCIQETLSVALAMDYKMYLQNDILTKVDRATMSVSLEGREPFLDHRIIEFVAQLPYTFKLGYTSKMILKDIVYKYIPKDMMDRPKAGFEVPISQWLKGDLSYLLDDYLNEIALKESGVFNVDFVNEVKADFFSGKLKDPFIIWKILQFQMWYKKWMN